jgi:cytochrome c oxidase subunit 2
MSDESTSNLSATPGSWLRGLLQRADARTALKYFVIITAVFVGLGLWVYPRFLPATMSPEMGNDRLVIVAFTVISAPVVGLVLGLALTVFLNRHRGEGPPPEEPAREGSETPVVILWASVSSVLCLVAVIWGLVAMSTEQANATTNESSALIVDVTGSQWVWTFSYPAQHIESHQLILPLNRPVQFHVISTDVVHSFWPVQLGIKVDANAYQTTTAEATPNKLGSFQVRCAELCGLNHAYMQTDGEVVTKAQFDAWVKQQPALDPAVQP